MAEQTGQVPAALRWAASCLRANFLAFVLLAAVVTIIGFLQAAAAQPLNDALLSCLPAQTAEEQSACLSQVIPRLGPTLGVALAALVIQFLASIGVYRAALAATLGVPPDFSMMLSGRNLGRYILVTLASAALIVLGLILCIVPGLLALFWLQLAQFFALDRGYGVREAIVASFRVVNRNPGPALALLGITLLATIVGALLFGVLTLIALPFAALVMAHLYRTFNGEPVR